MHIYVYSKHVLKSTCNKVISSNELINEINKLIN